MKEFYDKLPEEAKEEVMDQLYQAILWRGWDKFGSILDIGRPKRQSNADHSIQNIVQIFHSNGINFPEYT